MIDQLCLTNRFLSLPVVTDAVEKAIAMVHHGSHGPKNSRVADKAGGKDEIPSSAAAQRNTEKISSLFLSHHIKMIFGFNPCMFYIFVDFGQFAFRIKPYHVTLLS